MTGPIPPWAVKKLKPDTTSKPVWAVPKQPVQGETPNSIDILNSTVQRPDVNANIIPSGVPKIEAQPLDRTQDANPLERAIKLGTGELPSIYDEGHQPEAKGVSDLFPLHGVKVMGAEVHPLEAAKSSFEIGKMMIKHPIDFAAEMFSYPAKATWGGMHEFLTQAAIPGGNEDFKNFYGDMTPDEAEEARRTFITFVLSSVAAGAAGGLVEEAAVMKRFAGVPRLLPKATMGEKILAGQAGALGFGTTQAIVGEKDVNDKINKALAYAIVGAPFALAADALLLGRNKSPSGRDVTVQKFLTADDLHNLRVLRHEADRTNVSHPVVTPELEIKQQLDVTPITSKLDQVRRLQQEGKHGEAADLLKTGIEASKATQQKVDHLASERLDVVSAIVRSLADKPEDKGVSFLSGIDNPFAVVRKLTNLIGENKAFYTFFKRSDGKFDIALGNEKSPLLQMGARQQFQREGYYDGQLVSVNGKDYVYTGKKDDVVAWVRNPGSDKRFTVNYDDIRRVPYAQEVPVRTTNINEMRDILKDDKLFERFKQMYDKVHPNNSHIETPDLESAATSNGYTVSNTGGRYILRDRETGRFVQSFANSEETHKFINQSGQKIGPDLLGKQQERIATVGFRLNDGTIIKGEPGDIHADLEIRRELKGRTFSPITGIGFITTEGRYLTRDEAYALAEKSNQLTSNQEVVQEGWLHSDALKQNESQFSDIYTGKVATKEEALEGAKKELNRLNSIIGGITPPPPIIGDALPPINNEGPRFNEPFELPRNGTISNFIAKTRQWLTAKRGWTPADKHFDYLEETFKIPISTEGYYPIQRAAAAKNAKIGPWWDRVEKELSPLADDLIPKELEQVHNLNNTRSAAEVALNMNPKELDLARAWASTGTDIIPILQFNERRGRALKDAARQLGKTVAEMKVSEKRAAIKNLAQSLNLSDQDVRVSNGILAIVKKKPEDFSIFNVINYVWKSKNGNLSRVDMAAKIPGRLTLIADKIKQVESDYLATSDIKDIQAVKDLANLIGETRELDPTFAFKYKPSRVGYFSKEQDFLIDMMKTGQLNFYSKDPINSLVSLINGNTTARELLPIWKSVYKNFNEQLSQKMASKEITVNNGKVIRETFNAYMGSILGHPEPTIEFFDKAFSEYMKGIGVETPVSFRKDLVDTFIAFNNGVAMAYRPGMGIRDFTTTHQIYSMLYGMERTSRAVELAKTANVAKMRETGIITTYSQSPFNTPEELYASSAGKYFKGATGWVKKQVEQGLVASLQKNSYEFWQAGSYLEGRERALQWSNKIIDGTMKKQAAYEKMGLFRYDDAVIKKFDDFMTRGLNVEAADFLGKATMRDVQPLYGLSNHPYGWGKNHARLMGQYGTFNTWYVPTFLKAFSKGTPEEIARAYATFAIYEGGKALAGRALGINMFKWMALPGLVYSGGPFTDLALSMSDAASNSDVRRRMAWQHLGRMMNPTTSGFIVYPYFAKDWIEAAQQIGSGNVVGGLAQGTLMTPLRDSNPLWWEPF